MPKEWPAAGTLALSFLWIPLTGLLFASLGAGFIPSVRRSPVKRTLDLLALCALLLAAGLIGGFAFVDLDEAASQAAADEVVRRLEARRAETGAYPATLAELGELPAPRRGWSSGAFQYWTMPEDDFVLTWPSAWGPLWVSKAGRAP